MTPNETVGPYPSLADFLRSDIREGKPGVALRLTITVVNVNANCSGVANATVDIWQCDAEGRYSQYAQPGYNGTGETFLRGVQLTDANGQATLSTVYPGWYQGRATHIHVESEERRAPRALTRDASSVSWRIPRAFSRGQTTLVGLTAGTRGSAQGELWGYLAAPRSTGSIRSTGVGFPSRSSVTR